MVIVLWTSPDAGENEDEDDDDDDAAAGDVVIARSGRISCTVADKLRRASSNDGKLSEVGMPSLVNTCRALYIDMRLESGTESSS